MRRVCRPASSPAGSRNFCPSWPGGAEKLLVLATVTDRTDPQLVHLDGLNLSRAWCMRSIGSALPKNHPARKMLAESARLHAQAGLRTHRQRRLRRRTLAGVICSPHAFDAGAGVGFFRSASRRVARPEVLRRACHCLRPSEYLGACHRVTQPLSRRERNGGGHRLRIDFRLPRRRRREARHRHAWTRRRRRCRIDRFWPNHDRVVQPADHRRAAGYRRKDCRRRRRTVRPMAPDIRSACIRKPATNFPPKSRLPNVPVTCSCPLLC